MNSNYNQQHWKKKIADYLEERWSNTPSPFVQLSSTYFKPGAKVLELGTGAGQDGIWLEKQGFEVTFSDGDDSAFEIISEKSVKSTQPIKFDITEKFPFADNSFDVVYAQLVLHYFDDVTMYRIMNEIQRVLAADGILACMMNTVKDAEYKDSPNDGSGMIRTDKLTKRYFSKSTFVPFISDFEVQLFNENGRTPKDDDVSNSGMVQFIGRL